MPRHTFAVVRGESMLPTLREGDVLLVRRTSRPQVGDVAVLRLPSRPGSASTVVAVKRVVHRDADGWWVERDNPRTGLDSWHVGAVADSGILGVVLARVWPRPGLVRRGTAGRLG